MELEEKIEENCNREFYENHFLHQDKQNWTEIVDDFFYFDFKF